MHSFSKITRNYIKVEKKCRSKPDHVQSVCDNLCSLSVLLFQVFWRVIGPLDEAAPDIEPTSGSAMIQGDLRNGEIAFELLADNTAELDESFTLLITNVTGGAEIDTSHNSSSFVVR